MPITIVTAKWQRLLSLTVVTPLMLLHGIFLHVPPIPAFNGSKPLAQ
jgi:hypothetical protein